MSSDARACLRAGRVGRPHGLDGSFHVVTPVPELLVADSAVAVGGRVLRIVRRAGTDRRPIVRLEGCEDRHAAVALRDLELIVTRADAPALDVDEWWADDLEGCAVRDGRDHVGVVSRLLALPSCEVLEVQRSDRAGELLVPLVRDAVRAVDVQRRQIDIDLHFLGER